RDAAGELALLVRERPGAGERALLPQDVEGRALEAGNVESDVRAALELAVLVREPERGLLRAGNRQHGGAADRVVAVLVDAEAEPGLLHAGDRQIDDALARQRTVLDQ